jgi:molecular chaperone DnaK (HSP70)
MNRSKVNLLDNILLDYFVTQITNSLGVDIGGDKYVMILLVEVVEQAKLELLTQSEVTVSTPFIISSVACPGDPSVSICHMEFERVVLNLIQKI